MPMLPSGLLTFVFTDIEGSTALFQRLGPAYQGVLADHHALLRGAFTKHGGVEVRSIGDSLFVVFESALAALEGCADAQAAIAGHAWPDNITLRVRIGVHTGPGEPVENDYVALAVHQASRIAAAANGGQVLMSSDTADACGGIAPSDCELVAVGEFWLKDFPQPRSLLAMRSSTHPSDRSLLAPRTPSAGATNLPRQRTSFVGRDDERELLHKLIREHQVVTILGPGGVGKTRLAVEEAGDLAAHFPHGIWLVELAGIDDPGLVLAATATAVGVKDSPGTDLLGAVCDAIGDQPVLVVVDNCEHLLDSAARLVDAVVSRCPSIVVIATSREPLGVPGEQYLRLEPLEISEPDEVPAPANQLFVERARLVKPGFAGHQQTTSRICRLLDGIPLAIELAAALVDVCDPEQIVRELDDRFAVLTRGPRTVARRQQTLEASIAWSWDLLSNEEKTCLRRISILSSGTIESAAAIAADLSGPGDALPSARVAPALRLLASRSFLVDHGERWTVLESVRAFGLARSTEAGELEALRQRLAGFVIALARDFHQALRGAGDLPSVSERIGDEIDNVRAGLDVAVVQSVPEHPTPLDILDYFVFSGRHEEAQALAAGPARHGHIGGIIRVAQFELALGRTSEALEWCDRADAELARRRASRELTVDERHRSVTTALLRARTLAQCGRSAEAEAVARRSLADGGEDLLDTDWLMFNLVLAACLIDQDDLDEAADVLERGIRRARELGSPALLLPHLANAAVVLTRQGKLDESEQMLQEIVEVRGSMGDAPGEAAARINLGDVLARRGELAKSASHVERAISLVVDTNQPVLLRTALVAVAELLTDGNPAFAARMLGAADAADEQVGGRAGTIASDIAALEMSLEERLGTASLERERSHGRAQSLETSIAEASSALRSLAPGEG